MNEVLLIRGSEFQGKLFAKASKHFSVGSLKFIFRFLTSKTASLLDKDETSYAEYTPDIILNQLAKESGAALNLKEGVVLNEKVMYWLGYIYRYLCLTKNITSKEAFKLIKPKDLAARYEGLHTQSPDYVVNEIYNEKQSEKYALALETARKIYKSRFLV